MAASVLAVVLWQRGLGRRLCFLFLPPSLPWVNQSQINWKSLLVLLRYIADRVHATSEAWALWVIPVWESIPSHWERNEAVDCTDHRTCSSSTQTVLHGSQQKSELSHKIWSQRLILSSFEDAWISPFTVFRGYGSSGSRLCYKSVSISQIQIIVCSLKWSMRNPSFIILA